MIHFITGIPARLWGYALAVAIVIGASLKLVDVGKDINRAETDKEKQEAKDADQNRANDIRADTRASVHDDTSGYRD